MKKTILLTSVAMITLGIISESWAATCAWNGTKLTITGSGDEEFTGCDDNSDHKSATEVTFGEGITSIGESAFYGASSLTNVNMLNVTEIGDDAFYNATALNHIEMPKVTYIGGYAFEHASSLTQLELPETLQTVGSDAFRTHSNIELIIPDSLDMSDWDDDTLNDNGEGLTTFRCKGNQKICQPEVQEYMGRMMGVSTEYVSYASATEPQCTGNYGWTGKSCARKDENGNVACASGYADYKNKCWAELPFSKKRLLPRKRRTGLRMKIIP